MPFGVGLSLRILFSGHNVDARASHSNINTSSASPGTPFYLTFTHTSAKLLPFISADFYCAKQSHHLNHVGTHTQNHSWWRAWPFRSSRRSSRCRIIQTFIDGLIYKAWVYIVCLFAVTWRLHLCFETLSFGLRASLWGAPFSNTFSTCS